MDVLSIVLLLWLWCAEFATGQNFTCNTPNIVRLNPANYFTTSRSGRVEICDCDLSILGCQWMTITVRSAAISWGWKNALVACRELYPDDYGVMNPILQDTLPVSLQASSLQLVYSSLITCDGTESTVVQCSKTPVSTTSHARDAHIQCRSSPPVVGDVRLTGFTDQNAYGTVEYYQGGTQGWVTICTDSWDSVDANVTCFQLGYDSGIRSNFGRQFFLGTNFGEQGLFDVGCSGTEPLLDTCSHSTSGSCTNTNLFAGVICTSSELGDGSVRLYPSTKPGGIDQRVEVLYDGRWGTICDSSWDTEDGSVVCSALGGGSVKIESEPTFSSVSYVRPIWITELVCGGSEFSLTECIKVLPIGYVPGCTHLQDAALSCDDGLSGGEIAGIVIGVLCGLGLIGLIFHLHEQKKKKKAAAAAAEQNQRTAEAARAEAARAEATRAESAREEAATVETQRTREHSSSRESNEPGHSALESDTELRKAAPPSYDDAIRFIDTVKHEKNDFPQSKDSAQPVEPGTSLPSYPINGANVPYPSTDSTNLHVPYPDTSGMGAPFPTAGTAETPYPHADIATAPYPPASNVQDPYPYSAHPVPGSSNVQGFLPPTNPGYPPPANPGYPPPTNLGYPPSTNPGYPPPTNPGYPPPTNPGYPPPTHPAQPPSDSYPLQPITTLAYDPAQPMGDVLAPLPPVMQPFEDEEAM